MKGKAKNRKEKADNRGLVWPPSEGQHDDPRDHHGQLPKVSGKTADALECVERDGPLVSLRRLSVGTEGILVVGQQTLF